MTNTTPDHKKDVADAETIVSSLRKQYEEWRPIEGNARKRLWEMLGDLYAAIPVFEESETERHKLNDIVRQDENVQNSERFKPAEESVVDLLLVSVLSLCKETSATKSQWRAALIAAKIAKVENNTAEFQEWLAKIGGIVASKKADLSIRAKGSRAIPLRITHSLTFLGSLTSRSSRPKLRRARLSRSSSSRLIAKCKRMRTSASHSCTIHRDSLETRA